MDIQKMVAIKMKEKIKWRRVNSFSEIGFVDSDPFSIYYRSDFSMGIIKFVKPKAIFTEVMKLSQKQRDELYHGTDGNEDMADRFLEHFEELKKKWCE